MCTVQPTTDDPVIADQQKQDFVFSKTEGAENPANLRAVLKSIPKLGRKFPKYLKLMQHMRNDFCKNMRDGDKYRWSQLDRQLLVWAVCYYYSNKEGSNQSSSEILHMSQEDWARIGSALKLSALCVERQWKMLQKTSVREIAWTAEEDSLLTSMKSGLNHQTGEWSKIGDEILQKTPTHFYRTPKQVRSRWLNYLQPGIRKDMWSDEEDLELMRHVLADGKKWSHIAQHTPGRNENQVKNRFYSVIAMYLGSESGNSSAKIERTEVEEQHIVQTVQAIEKKISSLGRTVAAYIDHQQEGLTAEQQPLPIARKSKRICKKTADATTQQKYARNYSQTGEDFLEDSNDNDLQRSEFEDDDGISQSNTQSVKLSVDELQCARNTHLQRQAQLGDHKNVAESFQERNKNSGPSLNKAPEQQQEQMEAEALCVNNESSAYLQSSAVLDSLHSVGSSEIERFLDECVGEGKGDTILEELEKYVPFL